MTQITIIGQAQQTGGQPAGSYNVMDSGAHGDGESDDYQHILDAIMDAEGSPVYFPAGTYLLSSALTVPDGADLVGGTNLGPSATTAWIQGKVLFGSGQTFTDLKIGPSSAGFCSAQNLHDATGTTFTRCHFRGGGGAAQENYSCLNIGSASGTGPACYDLTFTDCEFERSLGTFNTISIYAQGDTGPTIIDGVTFDGCNIGVSNGVASGSARMNVEAWTDNSTSVYWRNLTFTGCEFQVAEWHNLDFACMGPGSRTPGSGRGMYATVNGCTFHGSTGTSFGYALCSESADYLTITNNTFELTHAQAINLINFGWPANNHTVITDNIFNDDISTNGVVADAAFGNILCGVDYAQITGNTFTYSGVRGPMVHISTGDSYLPHGGNYNTVTGNIFNHNPSQTTISVSSGLIDNTVSPNTEIHI